jgi:hypothetical protein
LIERSRLPTRSMVCRRRIVYSPLLDVEDVNVPGIASGC